MSKFNDICKATFVGFAASLVLGFLSSLFMIIIGEGQTPLNSPPWYIICICILIIWLSVSITSYKNKQDKLTVF